ncbi:AraC family transcriptional regulator [Pendulispora rubella]|uniref:AraC family transcriptional regulator n=1 Tax=Pendulispora rubella TaxID=2741070 RepID=A0ABZ2LJM9_9BACT
MAFLDVMQKVPAGESSVVNVVPFVDGRDLEVSEVVALPIPEGAEPIPDSAVNAAGALIRSQSLPILLAFAQRAETRPPEGAEGAVEELRRRLAIPEATGDLVKAITLPLSAYRDASEQLAALLQDEFIGLHAAQEAPRGSFGILEFVVRHVRNIDAALERTQRYWRLVSELAKLDIETRCGEVLLTYRIAEEPSCMGRQGNEFVLASFHRFLRELTQQQFHAASVEFAHPAPADVSELARFFGTEQLRFDAPHNRIAFDASVLSLTIPSSDERLLLWLDEYATSLLPPEPAAERAVPGLERQIRSCLHESVPPTVTEVARRLRISSRTLQRRLCEAHMSFYGVLEGIRCELAERYLHDASLSIYEVALRLGYANERGFERAFMKWHGVTPRAYRRKLAS